jgi:hypothetical protein
VGYTTGEVDEEYLGVVPPFTREGLTDLKGKE